MPTAAVCTMLKWIGSIPIASEIGNTTGIRTTAAGSPSSRMPNRQVMTAVPIRERHGCGLCREEGVASDHGAGFGRGDDAEDEAGEDHERHHHRHRRMQRGAAEARKTGPGIDRPVGPAGADIYPTPTGGHGTT